MSRRRRQRNEKKTNNKTVIRCKNKMIPVFETDTCKEFVKKDQTNTNNICINCKYSF
jgi:hypothetical protein